MKDAIDRHFKEEDLHTNRFVSVKDGGKMCVDHDTRYEDPREVPGQNYGIYSNENDQLAVLDVDYHREGGEEIDPRALGALSALPQTLKIQSPHVPSEDRGGHRIFKLKGDETPAELFQREFGTKNPVASWGEVIAKNKYIVGAGSQLNGCTKDWCDDCATEDGGWYKIKKDRPIATVEPDALVEALKADPDLSPEGENQSLDEAAQGQTEETPETDDTRKRDYSRDEIESMLEALPGDQHFDDWIRTGYTVCDWDSGETGKEVFEEWSRENPKWEESESQRQIDYIWSNGDDDGDRDGNASVGTLVHLARKNGWEDPKGTTSKKPENSSDIVKWDYVRALFEDSEVDDKKARRWAAIALRDREEYLYVDGEDKLLKYYEPDGVFETGGKRHVKKTLARELGMQFSTHDRNEILATVEDLSAVDVTTLNADEFDEKLLCLENGVLDLDTRELLDHDPKYKFTNGLPITYDPDATASRIEKFLSEITSKECHKRTLEEMVGAAIHPDYLKSKFLFLFGEGQNGKGMYFELLSRFLGRENVVGRDLHELANDDYAKADLHDAMANIGGDIDDRKLKNTGTIKRLTSNTDTITAHHKFGQPFEFVNSATLFFAANEPPAIDDVKRSMGRRIVPVHMPYEFIEDPDPENSYEKQATEKEKLLYEMTTSSELAGLLNLALDGMDRLLENGDVSLEMDPMERLEFYQRFSDPIYRFATECVVKDPEETVEKADVYEAYKSFSRAEGHGVRHDNVFWREFRRVFHFEETRPRRADGSKEPRQLLDTRFTEQGLNYASEMLEDKYGDQTDETETEDTNTSDSPSALKELEPGRHTLEVTIAEKLDPKPWQQGRGHVVDDEGNILPYVAEGTNPLATVDEGQKVRLINAKIGTDRDDLRQLQLTGLVEVEAVATPDDTQESIEGVQAAPDGGTEPEPDGSHVQRVAETVRKASEPVGMAHIIQHTEGSAEPLRDAIQTATQTGKINEQGDDQYTAD